MPVHWIVVPLVAMFRNDARTMRAQAGATARAPADSARGRMM